MVFAGGPHQAAEEDQTDDEVFLIFLSHVTAVKEEVQGLKEGLEEYGVEAFVADSDIHPGTEWQEEILGALEDMDAFVPILTEGFRDSQWTDQEVGYAIAGDVPIISLMLGADPHGFIGRYQGLRCGWQDAPAEIIKALADNALLVDGFIEAVSACENFDTANRLAEILPSIAELPNEQVAGLVSAFNENEQVSGSYGFGGTWPDEYGGLAVHLSRLIGQEFELGRDSEGRKYIGPGPFWFPGLVR